MHFLIVPSGGSKSSKIEGLGFLKPLLKGAVASGGPKSSKVEGLGFLKPLLRGIVASGGSKSSKNEGLVEQLVPKITINDTCAVDSKLLVTHKDVKSRIYDARSVDLVPQASRSAPQTP